MEALLVVDLCDEAVDVATGVVEVDESLAVDLFGLERLHEAFGLGVVEGMPGLLMLRVMSRSASRWR